VLRAAVALDELRLLFVPVPKAGSTALLWALAKAVGLRPEDFTRSRKLEVTRSLAIHDMTLWGSHRLQSRRPAEIASILASDEWFRVTVVRDPVRRLWSGWASKILVRDPRFAAAFAGRRPVSSSDEVVDGFRSFVRGLHDGPVRDDPHWAPQVELTSFGDVDYGHIGRFEELDRTVSVLRERAATLGVRLPEVRRENPSVVAFAPGVFDEASLAACAEWTARDRAAFGYERPPAGPQLDPVWHAAVEAAIPAIRAVAERNERIADLRRLVAPAPARRAAA
jgi:hypothetical protein